MQRFVLAAKCLIVFLLVLIVVSCSIYKYEIGPVSKDETLKEVIITEGSTWYSISNLLYENGLIKSEKFYKFYIKLFRPKNLEIGKYELASSMNLDKIVSILESGSNYNPDDISITFREGLNMRRIASLIAANTDNSEDDVFNTLKDTDYLDELINKYWFITDDIKNPNIYYPLEGYLFPNTYIINKKNSVKEIFKIMLDETDKVLSNYKEEFTKSTYSIHELMTLASIVELEAGNSNERSKVAGTFYNRLDIGMTLGSDVTAYYAYKLDDWTNGLTVSQIDGCNAYNTRGTCVEGLPIGPICNPGKESILAVLNPTTVDAYYFVADCDGNTYLNKTYEAHLNTIDKLKAQDKWCDK